MGDSYYGDSNNSSNLLGAMSYLSKLFGGAKQQQQDDNASWPKASSPDEYKKSLGETPSQDQK